MAEHAGAARRRLTGSFTTGEESITDGVDDASEEQQVIGIQTMNAATHSDRRLSRRRITALAVTTVVVALGFMAGWFGYRNYQIRQAHVQTEMFVEGARQGVLNLTTIDHNQVETDVQRILDSSTGYFRDDFQRRSQPFIDVVKQVQSKTEGVVTAAALESQNGDEAQVLVTVSVKTANAGGPEQTLRAWRMRIGVQNVGNSAKVSAVQFVP